jgi:hypothetical protein
MMTSRDVERTLLSRCAAAAKGELASAVDQREANVFRLASMVLRPRLPSEAARLMTASDCYFTRHPADLVASAEVVRNGWVLSVPRLRDMLTMQLRPH